MPIIFAPIPSVDYTATAIGRLRVVGQADAFPIEDGSAVALGSLSLTGFARAAQEGAPPVIVPPTTAYGSLSLVGEAFATHDEHVTAGAGGTFSLVGAAFASTSESLPAGSTDSFASGEIGFAGYAMEQPSEFGWGFLVDRPPVISASANALYIIANSGLSLSDDSFADYAVAINEVLRLTTQPLLLASFLRTVQSNVVLRDFATAVFEREVLSDLTLDDDFDVLVWAIVQVTDALLLQDESAVVLSTISTVVSALALRDSVRAVLQGEVPSEIELSDLNEPHINALVEAVSDVYLTAAPEPQLTLFSLVDDRLALDDAPGANLSALVAALAALELGVRVRVGDALYVGYAVNVRNAAVTEYANYPFNSMAVIGGVPYGAGPGGVFRLEGPDDDGTPIPAALRTGALAFDHLQRAPYGRIVFTADGQLLLRTITMDGGRREVATYRMERRPLGTAVESRFDLAKGPVGSVWAFELVNEDGAYFETDVLQVWMLQLSRRYSGR